MVNKKGQTFILGQKMDLKLGENILKKQKMYLLTWICLLTFPHSSFVFAHLPKLNQGHLRIFSYTLYKNLHTFSPCDKSQALKAF